MSKRGAPLGTIVDYISRARAFEREAHTLLGTYETAPSRVYTLDATYAELTGLTLKQDDLFRQAIRCVESELFRAAHVMGWAAFMDFLENKLAKDGLAKVRSVRQKWKAASLEDLRENVPEAQLLDVAKELGILTRIQLKAMQGLLSKRNECAHPSDYYPGFNETLGYISELFKRLKAIQPKSLV